MNRNIFAHTETTAPMPGYVSINRLPTGGAEVTTRTRGGLSAASLSMTDDELIGMAETILSELKPARTDPLPLVMDQTVSVATPLAKRTKSA